MNDLVTMKHNDIFTDSMVIAEGTGNKFRSVQKFIDVNLVELSTLGKIEICKVKTLKSNNQFLKVHRLNKNQAILLLQKMSRRTDISNAIKLLSLEDEIKIVDIRNEYYFYNILMGIINGWNMGTSNKISIKKQYKIGKYLIDYVITQEICGVNEPILLIEYDETRHKYRKEQDSNRQIKIIKTLEKIFDIYDCFGFCRVEEGQEFDAISEIVSFLNKNLLIEVYDNIDFNFITE